MHFYKRNKAVLLKQYCSVSVFLMYIFSAAAVSEFSETNLITYNSFFPKSYEKFKLLFEEAVIII